MKEPRGKDLPLYYLIGPHLDWLYYHWPRPDELPNDLTRLRMRLIPLQLTLLVTGLLLHNSGMKVASLLILWFQGVTDWTDGYIAWRHECASAEGAQMDPRADKLVVLPNLLLFAIWSIVTTHSVTSILLLVMMLIAVWLDVESDIWYRLNHGGKSNRYGKIKFAIHILVAAIGIAIMTSNPSNQTMAYINFGCSLLMLGAASCARTSLNLKQRGVTESATIEDSSESLVDGLAKAGPFMVD